MHMIFISADFQKPYLITHFNFNTYSFKDLFHFAIKYYPSVLCRKHHMVHQNRNIVTLMEVLTHLILFFAPQAAGY